MRKIYLLFFYCLCTRLGFCQDSAEVTTLHEVVISASRAEQPIIEIPRSVTVIDEEDIRGSIYQSVGELLNAQSGLFVIGTNQTPGTNQNIFMRGSNSNQVAVLVDGVRITDPSSPNAAIDFSEVSLTNIDRIEVIRGSHSTIYGGAAIGGVVNIITKKAIREGLHGNVSLQGGSFGKGAWSLTETADLNYTWKDGWYVNGSVFRYDVKGLNASIPSASIPSFSMDRDDFRKTDGSVKVGFKREKGQASISFKKVHQYTEIDDGAFADDDNHYLQFDRTLLQYNVAHKFNPFLSLTALGSFSDSKRFYRDDSSRTSPTTWDQAIATGTYFGKLQTHEAQLNFQRQQVQAMVGAGAYHESMAFDDHFLLNLPGNRIEVITNYDTLNTRTTTAYLFAQMGYEVGKARFSAGARVSRHTTAGNFLTFEFNPSYSFADLLIYGSLSTGFNAPTLYQLYDPTKSFAAFTTRGNRNLLPEESISIEVGVKKQFVSGSYLTLSGYRSFVTNAIEYVYLWNGEKSIDELDFTDERGDTYMNAGEQHVKGIELESFVQISPALSMEGNVSILEAKIKASPEDVDKEQTGGNHVQLFNLGRFLDGNLKESEVVRRPAVTAFARLGYKFHPALNVYATYRFTGSRFDAGYDPTLPGPYGGIGRIDVDGYHLVDVGVNWDLTKVFSVGLKLENISNENYREVVGFQTRGRSAFMKASFRF